MDAVETHAAQMMGRPYRSIGAAETRAVLAAMDEPLSGYLATMERGGKHVRALEDAWRETFGVKHAIACNSNTSGLLAAAFAAGLKGNDKFSCPAVTMTATAAAPMFTGAYPVFTDVESDTFGDSGQLLGDPIKAMFVTNLFGHPAELARLRRLADQLGRVMIEDNAQAPFAQEDGRYAGTIGHIGVFSLNVHKHFHCGEGGIVVTDDDYLAWRMRGLINHGEGRMGPIGLNLRMPEICAAIALSQLKRGRQLVLDRVEQAHAIMQAIGLLDHVRHPIVRDGCVHVFYIIPFLIDRGRAEFCASLHAAGVPVTAGYQNPLYRLPAFARMKRKDGCPVAEDLEDRRLFHIENCAHTFSRDEIRQIGDAFKRAADAIRPG